MCGIVYSKSFTGKPVVATIVERYKAQKMRGSNGFGFYVPQTNRLTHNTKEGRILSLLKREVESEILFHHRFPTSTSNVRQGCHPYSTKDYFENNYVVVHNGVLHNERELKKAHDELGIAYVSLQEDGRFNDSEALAFDIARYLEGEKDTIEARGSIAFIAIKRDKGGKPMTLFFGRNHSNPLKMKKTRFSLTLSSEGEGVMIDANTLYSLSYDTLELTKRPCMIGSTHTQTWNPHTQYSQPSLYNPAPKPEPTTAEFPFTDDKDDDDYEYRTNYRALVKEAKDELMFESEFDTAEALKLGEYNLKYLKDRQKKLDKMSAQEEDEIDVGIEEINEYIGNEEDIRILEDALEMIRQILTTEAIRRDTGRQPIGFHYQEPVKIPATAVRTGITHPVVQRDANTHQGDFR